MGKFLLIIVSILAIGFGYHKKYGHFPLMEPRAKKVDIKIAFLYNVGQCLSMRNDDWLFYKISGRNDSSYIVEQCHKYKGCSDAVTYEREQFEFEHKKNKVIICPQLSKTEQQN